MKPLNKLVRLLLALIRSKLFAFIFGGVLIMYIRMELGHQKQTTPSLAGLTTTRQMPGSDDRGGRGGMEFKDAGQQHEASDGKFPYLQNYKNPCWWNSTTSSLLCLPYFYLIGFGKSGTSTIFYNTCLHPEIAKPPVKEIRYWTRERLLSDSSILEYARMFKNPTAEIQNATVKVGPSDEYHHKVTGEGTPSYVWELFGNEMHKLQTKTKLIITMRHPTDRLFSHYHHDTQLEKKSFSAKEFHNSIATEIDFLKECFKIKPAEFCVTSYDREKHPIGVSRSVYVYFIRAWLDVFPKEQVLFIQAEEFYQYPMSDFKKIYKFLGLSPPDTTTRDILKASLKEYNTWAASVNKTDYRDQMWPSTKVLLDDFFAPFNQMLYDLLRDNRFLFRRVPGS